MSGTTTSSTLRQPAATSRTGGRLRESLQRWLARWREWREWRAAERLDRHHRRERNEHERFLAQARDVYELERLERDWQRRHTDLWRVF